MSSENRINGDGPAPLRFPGPDAKPGEKVIERDSPALVAAREKLAALIARLDVELAQANRAHSFLKQDGNLRNFVGLLANARAQAVHLHALAYANSIQQRYDDLQPTIIETLALARSVGLCT